MKLAELWYRSTTSDPGIAGKAFAAAGALTAAGWDSKQKNAAVALLEIMAAAGSNPILWKYPAAGVLSPAGSIADEALAEAWHSAFKHDSAATNPMVRLVVDTASFVPGRSVASELVEINQILMGPPTSQPRSIASDDVTSLAFASFDAAKAHSWNWPLSLGVTAPKGAALNAQLPELRGVRYDYLSVMPSGAVDADFMLVTAPTVRNLDALSNTSIGMAVVRAPEAVFGKRSRLLQHVMTTTSVPTVMVDVPEKHFGELIEIFTDGLAHNKHLDVALFDASRNFQYSGQRSPILFMPRADPGEIFSGVRPQNAVVQLRDRLHGLPRTAIVGAPPDHAYAIGIAGNERTVGDYLDSMTQAIDGDRIVFGSEKDAQALSLTTKKVDRLVADLSKPADLPQSRPSRRAKGFTNRELYELSPQQTSPQQTSARDIVIGDQSRQSLDQPPPFAAYARLDAPDIVTGGKPFEFEVGFGNEPDTKADKPGPKIVIGDAQPGDNMLVIVAAENGTILSQPNHARLLLKLDAKATFKVLPAADAPYVRLSAEYLFRNETVGLIVRTLALAGRAPPPPEPADADLFWPVLQAIAPGSLDLTLFVKLQETGKVTWQAVDRASGRISKMIPIAIGDTKAFANKLVAIQRRHGDKGFLAQESIGATGQLIADHIPQEIQEDFLAHLLKGSSPPRVLILSNEPYIPWELALLLPEVTGKSAPMFFGATACIGRWWVGTRMSTPPVALKVQKISAVAADSYDLQTNKGELPQAKAEKEWLTAKFKALALAVDGRLESVIAWLKTLPIGPGHLAHFALHGFSVPQGDEQALILGDGGSIDPGALAGLRRPNQDPRFGMVFLNACQVGTAGQTLGQIAGFPGDLLRAGTGAVVGPLWEVNDVAAHAFAQSFYEMTFDDSIGVSEALRRLREKYNGDSITPLAYIYYGHPGLILAQ
jgi:hypothetical protein